MIQKVNEVFKPLFTQHPRYFILMGGRGAGRSTVASQFANAKLIAPEYFRCAIMRYILGDIRNSIFREITDRAEENGIDNKLHISDMNIEYGQNSVNAVGFRKSSGDQKSKLKSLASYNCVIIEEADEIPEEDFMQLDDSLRTVKGDITIILLLNPPAKGHWILNRWFNLKDSEQKGFYIPELKSECKDTIAVISDYHSNEQNLAKDSITQYENYKLTKPNHYWNMIKGYVPETVQGLIYKNFKIIDELPDSARLKRRGLDYGYTCFVGNTLIKCINGDKRISDIKVGDLVLTRIGYKPVKNIFNNGKRNVIDREITLSNNSKYKISGTPDHNFNVNNKWKTLNKIQTKDKLYVLKGKYIIDTKTENTQTISITQLETVNLFFIEKYIRNIMEIYQQVISFIMLTVILLTTKLQTLLLLLFQTTLKYIKHWISGTNPYKELINLNKLVSVNQIGTIEDKRFWKTYKMKSESVNGVEKNIHQQTLIRDFVQKLVITVGNIKQNKIKYLSYAKTAIRGLWGISILNQNRVQSNVPINYQSIIEIKTTKEEIDTVYNIEVEGIHEYFANGILVYNCDPTAIVDVYIWNNAFIWDEVFYRKGASNKDIADVIKMQPESVLLIPDSAEPKSNDELISYGISLVPSQKGQGSVNQGIQYVQDQTVYITKRSLNLIKEKDNYAWMIDKKTGEQINTPIDMWNHGMDGGRYAMESLKPVDNDDEVPPDDTTMFQGGNY